MDAREGDLRAKMIRNIMWLLDQIVTCAIGAGVIALVSGVMFGVVYLLHAGLFWLIGFSEWVAIGIFCVCVLGLVGTVAVGTYLVGKIVRGTEGGGE